MRRKCGDLMNVCFIFNELIHQHKVPIKFYFFKKEIKTQFQTHQNPLIIISFYLECGKHPSMQTFCKTKIAMRNQMISI